MATLNEMPRPSSRKYVAEQGIVMPSISKTFQALEEQPKKIKFSEFFLPLRDPFVATFNERRAPTSRKYVAERGILIPN